MEKKFELPYNFNFDSRYFLYLERNKDLLGLIDTVYMPCMNGMQTDENGNWNASHNTREEYPQIQPPCSVKSYKWHVDKLRSYNLPVTVLIQRNASEDMVSRYVGDIGVSSFIINDDALAIRLREKYGDDVNLRLSITRMVTEDELNTLDLSMYDDICLFFNWTRQLDRLKELPGKYNYVVIVNSTCMWYCSMSRTHWFSGKDFVQRCGITTKQGNSIVMDKATYVRPEDLSLFDPYIDKYKIQGRENPSGSIFATLRRYAERKDENTEYINLNRDKPSETYNVGVKK